MRIRKINWTQFMSFPALLLYNLTTLPSIYAKAPGKGESPRILL